MSDKFWIPLLIVAIAVSFTLRVHAAGIVQAALCAFLLGMKVAKQAK